MYWAHIHTQMSRIANKCLMVPGTVRIKVDVHWDVTYELDIIDCIVFPQSPFCM